MRLQRSAHQAVEQAQADMREGDTWMVDIDLLTIDPSGAARGFFGARRVS